MANYKGKFPADVKDPEIIAKRKNGQAEKQIENKKAMLLALNNSYGVVSEALKKVGIKRDTHQVWLRNDPDYKASVEEVQENLKDLIESAIISRVLKEDTSMLIHLAKTKLKGRSYGESQDVSGTITIKIVEE